MGSVTGLIGAKVSQIGSAIGIPGPDPSDGGSSELIKVQTICLSEDKMPRIVQDLETSSGTEFVFMIKADQSQILGI